LIRSKANALIEKADEIKDLTDKAEVAKHLKDLKKLQKDFGAVKNHISTRYTDIDNRELITEAGDALQEATAHAASLK